MLKFADKRGVGAPDTHGKFSGLDPYVLTQQEYPGPPGVYGPTIGKFKRMVANFF